MSSGKGDPGELSGTLYRLPFLAGELGTQTASIFAELADEFGVENILVVKRFPTETAAIARRYASAVETVEQPDVVGLTAHAIRTIEEYEDPPRRLDRAERALLLARFIEEYTWETEYLQRAAGQESFEADVGRFITEATWQGSHIDSDDPVLSELDTATDAYHAWLADTQTLDPAMLLQCAADALDDPATQRRVQASFDAVLALEFEEFTPIDRTYLARLTDGCELVCVAEAESAIQRTWNEPGHVTDHTPGMSDSPSTPPVSGEAVASSLPAAVASFLATGDVPAIPPDGDVAVIKGETVMEQVLGVAQEIERLRRVEDIPYDEMAVVLRDVNAPITETLQGLRSAGIPVASATVSGLEHDPAARELYALGCWCHRQTTDTTDGDGGWSEERARRILKSRIPNLTEEFLDTVARQGREGDLSAGVDEWLLETDLKHRIADSGEPLTVKTQFDHVRAIRSLAAAIDRSDRLDASWETFCAGMEREMQRATSDKVASDVSLPEDGVLVDAVRVVKNAERAVVFLVGVVDREYPAEQRFNALFPTPHLQELPAYPAFSTPDATDVEETFAFVEEAGSRPLHAYYAALNRRMLAVGARAAADRLYFGTYRTDATSGQHLQPSRFLAAIDEAFGELERIEHDAIHSYGEAVRFALDGVESAFEDVKRGGVVREPVEIAEVEADFAAIQGVLAADPPPDLVEAIRARVAFAAGAVARE